MKVNYGTVRKVGQFRYVEFFTKGSPSESPKPKKKRKPKKRKKW